MTATWMEPTGLRERKKRRTRDALVDAAFDLFRRKGFDATTIDEIADLVEVSPRTFFRYFESKEDVALTLLDQQFSAVYARFAERPSHEPVLTALRHAVVEMMTACEGGTGGFDAERFSCAQQVIKDSPAVHARNLEMCTSRLDELARYVAERMGVDPAADPRPTLVAAVVTTAVQTAIVAWRAAEPETPASLLADRALALLEQGINYPSA
ncbi:MAG TPA: TetR family transcriptional regulator [Micromonosporaceae bacterium]|jgi:AcrR family transcriptional regulator|nr:TetR family transcriptional regulator [Micromonosporaceae bacterium]